MPQKWMRYLPVILVAAQVILLVAIPGQALALGDPGKNIGNWLYTNVIDFFPPLIAIAGLFFLAKREFTTFVGFLVFAIVVAVIVYFPAQIKTVAGDLWNTAWGN